MFCKHSREVFSRNHKHHACVIITIGKVPHGRAVKTVDEEAEISCLVGRGKLREEVWQDATGKVVRYNLAFINHVMHGGDNGRVLGYDMSHGFHHRHFMGKVEKIDFAGYEKLSDRFLKEVAALRNKGRL